MQVIESFNVDVMPADGLPLRQISPHLKTIDDPFQLLTLLLLVAQLSVQMLDISNHFFETFQHLLFLLREFLDLLLLIVIF